jgi:hypothetical protein
LRQCLGTGRREAEASCEHRVDDDPVAVEIEGKELPAAFDADERLADERIHLGRRAAQDERLGHRHRSDAAAAERVLERFGEDREVR